MGQSSSSNDFKDGVDAFVDAAAHGRWDEIEELLTQGAMYLNAKDSQGRTALTAALLNKQQQVVDKLLEIPGIAINGKDKFGVTPLMLACANGDANLVARLTAAGAPVDALEEQDLWTPLHFAVAHGHLHIVEQLHQAGATLERWDRYGQVKRLPAGCAIHMSASYSSAGGTISKTLLHVAADVNSVPIMKYLLEAGLSSDVTDKESRTPYELAESDEMRDLFLRVEHDNALKDELELA